MHRKSTKLVALILMLVFACMALTACGGNEEANQPAEGGNEAAAVADTLVFAQGADPRGLDPALVDDGESSKVIVNIYEGLLQFAKDSTEVEPCLAKSWDISEDGLTYTFHLQEGVLFHDGTPFNAEAVKWNVDRQTVNKTPDMGYAGFVYGDVVECNVIDEYTVEMVLSQPSTAFLNNLAMSLAAPMVSPTAVENSESGNLMENPCGTGPYKFVSWTKESDIQLVRNEEYWGGPEQTGLAKTQNIIIKIIKENASRATALQNGEVDIIDGIDANIVEQIESSGMVLEKAEGMNINYMAYNTERAPMNDPEVRKAISQAINVEEMVAGLYKGYASEAHSILPSFMPGYSADVTQVAYDPEAAKATLAEKGVTSLHIITYSNVRPYNTVGGVPVATAVQQYLAQVGVDCSIDQYDWTTYKDKVKTRDFDICFYGWIGDNGDPDNFMSLLSEQDPTMNVAMYNNPEFNALLEQASQTPNGEERNAIYAEMEQLVADQAVWLPISHQLQMSAHSPAVQNYSYHQTGNIFFKDMYKNA